MIREMPPITALHDEQGRKTFVAARPGCIVARGSWHENVGRPGGLPH
jgi:hypothetical protein